MFRYTATAQLCPPRQRALLGWIVGWLKLLGTLHDIRPDTNTLPRLRALAMFLTMSLLSSSAGQLCGLCSTEIGLANMIWAAVVISKVCIILISSPGADSEALDTDRMVNML